MINIMKNVFLLYFVFFPHLFAITKQKYSFTTYSNSWGHFLNVLFEFPMQLFQFFRLIFFDVLKQSLLCDVYCLNKSNSVTPLNFVP